MKIFKEIPGYEGLYEACSDGSIWTCEGKTTYRILNGNKQKRVWKRRKMKPKYENVVAVFIVTQELSFGKMENMRQN